MGLSVELEESFPCPCKSGTVLAQVVEHDTYGSGRHTRYSMECQQCANNYVEEYPRGNYIRRIDAEEITRRRRLISEKRETAGRLAVERYLPKVSQAVKEQRFKTGMHSIIGEPGESIRNFRGRASSDAALDAAIRRSLSGYPELILQRIKIEDKDIEEAVHAIQNDKRELDNFERCVERYTYPDIDNQN